MIRVVHVKEASPEAIYVGRWMPGRKGSPLGNPVKPNDPNDEDERQQCLRYYKKILWQRMQRETPQLAELRRIVELAKVGDVELACWCAPRSCHAEVIKAAVEYLMEAPSTSPE